jgi:hypothetical protein
MAIFGALAIDVFGLVNKLSMAKKINPYKDQQTSKN